MAAAWSPGTRDISRPMKQLICAQGGLVHNPTRAAFSLGCCFVASRVREASFSGREGLAPIHYCCWALEVNGKESACNAGGLVLSLGEEKKILEEEWENAMRCKFQDTERPRAPEKAFFSSYCLITDLPSSCPLPDVTSIVKKATPHADFQSAGTLPAPTR